MSTSHRCPAPCGWATSSTVAELAARPTVWIHLNDSDLGPLVALTCAERDALVRVVTVAGRHCRDLNTDELCRALDALDAVPASPLWPTGGKRLPL